MSLDEKRKLLQDKLHTAIKKFGLSHPITIDASENLDKVIEQLQKK